MVLSFTPAIYIYICICIQQVICDDYKTKKFYVALMCNFLRTLHPKRYKYETRISAQARYYTRRVESFRTHVISYLFKIPIDWFMSVERDLLRLRLHITGYHLGEWVWRIQNISIQFLTKANICSFLFISLVNKYLAKRICYE